MPDVDQLPVEPEELLDDEFREKWIDKKHDSGRLADVYEELGLFSQSERVRDCGSILQFLWSGVEGERPTLTHANFCRDRLCPLCNWRRTMKIFGQVSQVMQEIGCSFRFIFCTLTVRNCSGGELPLLVDRMQKAWNRMMTYKDIKAAFRGWFRALEIVRHPDYRPDIEYHPHFHIIFAVNPSYFTDTKIYVSTQKMVRLWGKAMQIDYDPVCDLRVVRPKQAEKYADPAEIAEGAAVAEVAKYAVKSADYLRGRFDKVAAAVSVFLASLSNRRLCSYGGVFKETRQKLGLDDETDGDLIHTDNQNDLRSDLRYMILEYRWRVGFGYELQFKKTFFKEK